MRNEAERVEERGVGRKGKMEKKKKFEEGRAETSYSSSSLF